MSQFFQNASSASGVVDSVTGTNGVTALPTTGAVTVSGVNATTTTPGVASFNPAQFTVAAGAVSLLGGAGGAIQTINTIGPNASGNFSLLGTPSQVAITAGTNQDTISLIGPYTPITFAQNGILFGNAGSSIGATSAVNNGVLITSNTGVPSLLANGTVGQVLTAQTSGPPIWTTISTAGLGLTWSDTSGTVLASINNGYFITAVTTSTLPASPGEQDAVAYIVDTGNLLTITANTGQKIRIGTTISASGGTAVNTQQGDSIILKYRASSATWYALGSPAGGWNVT
jgi:hypothetical protein